jgi:hypothetical protein
MKCLFMLKQCDEIALLTNRLHLNWGVHLFERVVSKAIKRNVSLLHLPQVNCPRSNSSQRPCVSCHNSVDSPARACSITQPF